MTTLTDQLRAMSRREHDDLSLGDEAADEIERLRDAIKRQAAAAKTGMDAATRISSVQLEQARIARAESSPDAIDSERNANAVLTGEVERLRAELAAAKREYREGGQSRPVREWENLFGSAPNATGSLSSEAFVRKQRDDDWP